MAQEKTTKQIIWTSDIYDEDYFQELKDNYPDCSDEQIWDIAIVANNDNLDEIKANLSDITFQNSIIALGTLGMWSGIAHGYKILSNQITNYFQSFVNGDSQLTIYTENKDLWAKEDHHDGTNYYRFRVFRDNMSEGRIEKFLDKVYHHTVTEKDIQTYTKSVWSSSVEKQL